MAIKRIETPAEGNPFYPLPPDYHTLSDDGQREARVNACRQWWYHMEQRSPSEMKADAFVASLAFFDQYYLNQERDENNEVIFDPQWYKSSPVRTADFHWQIARYYITRRLKMAVAPRGSGKSKRIGVMMMLQMLSTRYDFIYATAADDLAEEMGDNLKYQLYENPRIHDDWGPEYGGTVKPKRGDAKMGMGSFKLTNRSSFIAKSAKSRQRGGRPTQYILDDPEYDPTRATSMEDIRAWMDLLVQHIVLPMIQEKDTGCLWIGTFVSVRHALWNAMDTRDIVVDGKVVKVAANPIYNQWTRIIMPAATEEDGVRKSCWPEMWPADEAERDRVGAEDRQTLAQIELEIGTPAFMAEYMAQPGEGGSRYFPQLKEELHGYWFENHDDALLTRPLNSKAQLCFYRGSNLVKLPLGECLRRWRRFETADTAYTNNASADWKVGTVMAHSDHNELFVFDMVETKEQPDKFEDMLFGLADRWFVPDIHIEAITSGITLINDMREVIITRSHKTANVEHLPAIRGFNPGHEEKTAKIASLNRRFTHGLIKLPMRMRHIGPWKNLFSQIEGFSATTADGGLAKDDHIDTVAMSKFVLLAPPSKPDGDKEPPPPPMDRLKAGDRVDDHGTALAEQTNFATLRTDDLMRVLTKHLEQPTRDVELC